MATHIDMEMSIDAHVEELFDLMADPSNEAHWNPDLIEIRRIDEGPLRPGAQWLGRYKGMGEMRIALAEYERPSRLGFTTIGERMDMRFGFDFSEAWTATRVVVSADIEPKGALRLLRPLFGPMMRRTLGRRPAQLAAGVEQMRA